MSKYALIIGASSGIAEAVARRYASQGWRLGLLARDQNKLDAIKADLLVRGASSVDTALADIVDTTAVQGALDTLVPADSHIDVVLIAAGTLPDQLSCESDNNYAMKHFAINATAVIAMLLKLAVRFEKQGHGCIAVITSVAGDRGRPSNYLYGSAKGAVSIFLGGLRARLFKKNVSVLDIRPGFVATAMTQDLDLPPLLTATPDQVAGHIVKAIDAEKAVVYTPGYWFFILMVIKYIPNIIFKRLNL